MATLTANTFLMYKASGSTANYTKLVDIKEFPDLGKAPDTIDVTTLTDTMKVAINDLQDPGSLEFTANYELSTYTTLEGLAGKQTQFAVWFGADTSGPKGDLGKFEFTGELAVWVKGAGVSAVREMGIAIAPSTAITKAS